MNISSVRLVHITPIDLGVTFYDQTMSALEADETLYEIVNVPSVATNARKYGKDDYLALLFMREYLSRVRQAVLDASDPLFANVEFVSSFPNVTNCISKIIINDHLNCYIMINGTAVFYDIGDPIRITDTEYFSISAFYARQVYEDDYCNNPDISATKEPVYRLMDILWSCTKNRERKFSASRDYHNNGIAYTLCITAIDIPSLSANEPDPQLLKNIYALNETSAFNNIYQLDQWGAIRHRIDHDNISDIRYLKLSENLIFSDSWAGVVFAGDLQKNWHCYEWFLEFEIYLQSQWLMFDAYCEEIVRKDYSTIELQNMLNVVENDAIRIRNDIGSNLEQSRLNMRKSLIQTSNIWVIYDKMHDILDNKFKLKMMYEDKQKKHFAFLSDVALLIIAVLQVYGVIREILEFGTLGQADILSLGVTVLIIIVCIWIMSKGR